VHDSLESVRQRGWLRRRLHATSLADNREARPTARFSEILDALYTFFASMPSEAARPARVGRRPFILNP
jgi:hypothetical protein